MNIKSFCTITALALIASASLVRADGVQHSGAPSLTLFALPGFAGPRLELRNDTRKLKKQGFAAVATSMTVSGGRWEVCDRKHYRGTCEVFGPGRYSFSLPGWSRKIKSVRRFSEARPLITLFARPGMKGEHHSWAKNVPRLKNFATNDYARSARLSGGQWVLCANSKGKGRCETITRDVPDLATIAMAGQVSSVYRADDWRAMQEPDDYGSTQERAAYGPAPAYGGRGDRRQDDDGPARITLYDGLGYTGSHITLDSAMADLRKAGFSNRTRSVRLDGGPWELCDGTGYAKTCHLVRRDMDRLGGLDLDRSVSSLRPYRAQQASRAPGYEGQRTVFFARPAWHGRPVPVRPGVSVSLDADAFCQTMGLGRAVYYDQAGHYGDRYLIDVLCRR